MKSGKAFFSQHPRLGTWLVLATGMVTLLLWSARGAGLSSVQIGWLAAAVINVAAACTWLIGPEPCTEG